MSYSPTSTSSLQGLLVADMDWLTPDLAVGGDLSNDGADAIGQVLWLERQGVTDIIDCRQEHSDESLVADVCPSIRYHHLPTDDHGGELAADWWESGIEIARSVVERGGAVFVHCHTGVNRGPSLALAILFDRGVNPVVAFDLLRARRPQAYAIYASQYLRLQGRRLDAKALEAIMNLEFDQDDLAATIGRIRGAESGGHYRLTLQPCADRPVVDSSPDDTGCGCERRGSDRTMQQLTDLFYDHMGYYTTEHPIGLVRRLLEHVQQEKEVVESASPADRGLTELRYDLTALLDE